MSPPTLDLDVLYRRYGGAVLRRIRRFRVRPDEEEELLHEVFERALRAREGWRGDCHPLTWLYTVATRTCLNRLRDTRRREALLTREGAEGWLSGAAAEDPEVRLLVEQLWSSLDPELVLIAIHYHLDGMTQADVARLVGCSPRTVSTRLEDLRDAARRATSAPPRRPA